MFVYGTLLDPALRRRLLPHRPGRLAPARLLGHRRVGVTARPWPTIVADATAGAAVEGLLWSGLTATDVARLDAYEGDAFERGVVTVRRLAAHADATRAAAAHADCEQVLAWAWRLRADARDRPSDLPWSPPT